MVEILAPVGGREQLTAALRAGADAVYLGTQAFNARRNAENFTGEDRPNSRARDKTKRVWGMGPSKASTRRSTPFTIFRIRSTSPPKSA